MEYRIEEVNINDDNIRLQIAGLLRNAFGGEIAPDRLIRNTTTNSKRTSIYLGALLNNELIGFNAFISHDFLLNGIEISCFQSCWTATSDKHRGKKIFQNIINSAKETLQQKGAAFIFGFPNDNSYPIFIQKLGFREIPYLKWQLPRLPFIENFYFNSKAISSPSNEGQIFQNDEQLINLKQKEYGKLLIEARKDHKVIWGTNRIKEYRGFKIPFFEIGGITGDNPEELREMIKDLNNKINNAWYLQFTTCSTNRLNNFFHKVRPAQTNNLIVYDLNLNTADKKFNLFGGVKDVF